MTSGMCVDAKPCFLCPTENTSPSTRRRMKGGRTRYDTISPSIRTSGRRAKLRKERATSGSSWTTTARPRTPGWVQSNPSRAQPALPGRPSACGRVGRPNASHACAPAPWLPTAPAPSVMVAPLHRSAGMVG